MYDRMKMLDTCAQAALWALLTLINRYPFAALLLRYRLRYSRMPRCLLCVSIARLCIQYARWWPY